MFCPSKYRRTETKVEDDPLCSVCSALDFRVIFRDGIPREDAVVLGDLTDILKKDDQCGLCHLISVNSRQCLQPDINLGGITCRLYTMMNPPSLNYGTVRHSLHIATSGGHFGTQIRLLKEADSKIGIGREKRFHDQKVGPTVDVSLLKRWIQTCKQNHRKTCKTDWWKGTGKLPSRTIRVVDVDRMAIILAPPNCRFLALSYVWGGRGDAYWTTQANIEQRSLPGGLDASVMPGTISDTIQLVRQLGERYVWIDALCIVQDDPKDKEVQIRVMDLIYGNSALTICAVGCTSVQDPLPGIRPGTRDPKQHIAIIQGLHLALPLPNDRTVVRSTWNDRGWTYQEAMLSRRRVLLTAQQMHFECRYGNCNEQMPAAVIDVALLGQAIPASAPLAMGRGACLTFYARIIEEYTLRKLTMESDIVDAVAALLRVLTKVFKLADGYDEAFRFGMLLTRCLDQALLWQPVANAPHSRRVSPDEMKVTWPSWSWAAWRGGVRYVSTDVFGDIHSNVPCGDTIGQSLVQWYTVDDDGQPVRHYVEPPARSMFERDVDSTINNPSIAITGDIDPQQLITENTPLVPGTLIFRTSYSRFDVIKIDDVKSASAVANYAIYSILSDIPQPSTSIGRIILPSSTHSPTSYEFVVLSRDRGAGGFYDKFGGFYDMERLGGRYFKCMLNVMAVQKMKDEDRFERVGVGIIFEPSWLNSKPGEKIVYLG